MLEDPGREAAPVSQRVHDVSDAVHSLGVVVVRGCRTNDHRCHERAREAVHLLPADSRVTAEQVKLVDDHRHVTAELVARLPELRVRDRVHGNPERRPLLHPLGMSGGRSDHQDFRKLSQVHARQHELGLPLPCRVVDEHLVEPGIPLLEDGELVRTPLNPEGRCRLREPAHGLRSISLSRSAFSCRSSLRCGRKYRIAISAACEAAIL